MFEAEGDIGRQARATGNLASALEACGDLDEAEQAYREAADLLEMSGDDEERMLTLNALSQLQLRQRRPFDAAATLQAGVPSSRSSGIPVTIDPIPAPASVPACCALDPG